MDRYWAEVDFEMWRNCREAPKENMRCGMPASACPGEVDPVRRQGHAPTVESTALSGLIGSLGDPIRPESAVGLTVQKHGFVYRNLIAPTVAPTVSFDAHDLAL